jgi:hypothetical protein
MIGLDYLRSSVGHVLDSFGAQRAAKSLFSRISPESAKILRKHLAHPKTLNNMIHSTIGYGLTAGLPLAVAGAAIGEAVDDDPWKGARYAVLGGIPGLAMARGLTGRHVPQQLYGLING